MFDDGCGPSKAAPWRAGANETTTISFSHDVTIAGHPVRAGTYGLFLELQPAGPWTWNAIANWEIAIRNIPENQKVNLPVYEQALKALKEKS